MNDRDTDLGTIAFAEQLLTLLDRGSFSATYKYAVLLGLMDICLEHSGRHGTPPTSVTTRQLAEKVLALYWPQSRDFPGTGAPLAQNAGKTAAILRHVAAFKSRVRMALTTPLHRAASLDVAEWERLVAEVEWVLVKEPLPRLQLVGSVHVPLIYSIRWNVDEITRPRFERDEFGNTILFLEGAAQRLVRLSGLLRPILHREWAAKVAKLNRLPESKLEEFLFGADRRGAARLLPALRELQDGRCFYCARAMAKAQVDHFIPWARHPDDGIDNLVAADSDCNGAKSDHLAATAHLERWWQRSREHAADLARIAREARWVRHADTSLATASGIYWNLPEGTRLWRGAKDFVPFRLPDLERLA